MRTQKKTYFIITTDWYPHIDRFVFCMAGGSSRRGVQKILFVLANGKQTAAHDAEPLDKAVHLLTREGVFVFAIGIGSEVDVQELRLMTERNEDVIVSASFVELQNRAEAIKHIACQGR